MIETTLRPAGPYRLERSVRGHTDATRRLEGGVLRLVLASGGCARVYQRVDGTLAAHLPTATAEQAHEELRFLLCLDDDLRPFLRRAAQDPLLRDVATGQAGVRPVRVSTVAHALLRALSEQLITSREGRAIQGRFLRRHSPAVDDLRAPPTRDLLAGLSGAEVERSGLSGRRADALVRVPRFLDLEGLRRTSTAAVVRRLERERTLGPWSAGVICVYGLGRWEHGLVGDLGLVRLLGALRGRRVEPAETAALLEPWGEWAGLASLWLLRHPLAGQVGPPVLPDRRPARRPARPARPEAWSRPSAARGIAGAR
ncbi:MAG: hypothetical protein AVDCRST_MAG79-1745 [uncultured Thermoleophilia bacterium]|uniref:HhH-GPD domain-containing protein n=1 Tax=uncultured Thermoleophilia bacterium TaxID=1497501 RepID=A0A6J4U3X2_9ACTN|nr:MAG: hypothetical protein AVDCRST_MAG79-1745 [uncultured Thermoleophilia bacterium]